MELYNLLKHLQKMRMLRGVDMHDGFITITFEVPSFVYSSYEDFFKEFGYVISDVMIMESGIIFLTVKKNET